MANYQAVAARSARKYGIPVGVFLRQIAAESGWNPNARSSAGALGIAQFMPATARGFHINPLDPVQALDAAARYDSQLVHKYGSVARALSAYNSGRPDAYRDPHFAGGQTYNYVRHILGGSSGSALPVAAAGPAAAAAAATGGGTPDHRAQLLALINSTNEMIGVPQLNVALPALQALGGAQTPLAATGAPPRASGGVRIIGNAQGLRPSLVAAVSAAAQSQGATIIRGISARRSPAHNAAVGGVRNSNHITGDAWDAEAFVPGRGWVPLGTLLRGVAPRYGLRSGDQPGFYRGGRDVNHVDDARNAR